MKYTARFLTAKNAIQYREIRLESLQAHPEAFGARYDEQVKLKKLFFERELERDDSIHRIIGVFKLGKLVGICATAANGKAFAEVLQMYVRPSHQGKGVVDLLLDHAAENARKAGCMTLRLTVRIANKAALKAYQKYGFELLDRTDVPKSHVMEYTLPKE